MHIKVNFIKFVSMMNFISLDMHFGFPSKRDLIFIVNWLVNPHFGGDFFCVDFFEELNTL